MAQGNTKRRPPPKGHPVRQAPETEEQPKEAGINFDPDEVTQKTFQRILPYYKFIFFVIIIAVIVFLVMALVRSSREKAEAAGQARLADATRMISPIDYVVPDRLKNKVAEQQAIYQDVISSYAGTAAAVDAEFHLAMADFRLGDFDKALGGFVAFATAHPDHQFAAEARINEANCLFGKKNYEAAFAKFKTVADDASLDAGSPRARADARRQAANCAAMLGDVDNARLMLEQMLEAAGQNENSATQLQSVIRRLEILPPLKEGIEALNNPPKPKQPALPDGLTFGPDSALKIPVTPPESGTDADDATPDATPATPDATPATPATPDGAEETPEPAEEVETTPEVPAE